jgi:hypothetical protein
MGQKKSVEKVDETMIDKYGAMLRDIQSHYMQLTIHTAKEPDNMWKANGTMQVGSSADGKHWGEVAMNVKGYDINSDSALATVMIALNNYINSPEFVIEMGTRMEQSLGEEENFPAILVPGTNE